MLSFNQILLGIFFFMPIITLIHELGHAFFAKLFKLSITSITLGDGKKLFSLGKLNINILYFWYGRIDVKSFNISKSKKTLFLLGGIIFNLISIIIIRYLININFISTFFFQTFITFSEFMIIVSIIPIKHFDGSITDGYQIWNLLMKNKK